MRMCLEYYHQPQQFNILVKYWLNSTTTSCINLNSLFDFFFFLMNNTSIHMLTCYSPNKNIFYSFSLTLCCHNLSLSLSLSLWSFGSEKLPCHEIDEVHHGSTKSWLRDPLEVRSCLVVRLMKFILDSKMFAELGRRSIMKLGARMQWCLGC